MYACQDIAIQWWWWWWLLLLLFEEEEEEAEQLSCAGKQCALQTIDHDHR